MATNPYFDHLEQAGEHQLFDNLCVESIQVSGFDIVYIPRENLNFDPVLFETNKNIFNNYWMIEATISENLTGWTGDNEISSEFGVSIDQGGHITFSKSRWDEIQQKLKNENKFNQDRPYEGDLIYFGYGHGKFNNTLFQINNVDFSDNSWQLGRNFVYRCKCSVYKPTKDDKINISKFNIDKQVESDFKTEQDMDQSNDFENIFQSLEVFDPSKPFGGH